MAIKERDYKNLKETERIYEAVQTTSTEVKDYSLHNLCRVYWYVNDYAKQNHLCYIHIGGQLYIGKVNVISRAIHNLVERQDDHDWLPKDLITVESHEQHTPDMTIDTRGVNWECLRDHVAKVTINKVSSIIDLEELLKATRYA